jgi:hypothetical protein
MAGSSSHSQLRELFQQQGYVVVKQVLDSSTCQILCQATYQRLVDIIFQGKVDITGLSQSDVIFMLTDEKLRIQKLGEDHAKIIYRHGNSRTPLISRSTGMSSQHYIPEVLEHVAFNQQLYQIASQLYGKQELAFKAGIEKLCFKSPGATAMDNHIDMCPFDSKVNYGERIQALVTASVGAGDKNGGLCLLVNFHHYFTLASYLFHPKYGPFPFPDVEASWSRFFVLPKGPSGFDKKYLPILQYHAFHYTNFIWQGKTEGVNPDILSLYSWWREQKVWVPPTFQPLAWTSIPLDPGDAVFWDQRLPHFSNANKTDIARVCFYYSTFPVEPDWYGNPSHSWLIRQISQLRFSYGREGNVFPENPHNPEEYDYYQRHPERAAVVKKIISEHPLGQRLCGSVSWFS